MLKQLNLILVSAFLIFGNCSFNQTSNKALLWEISKPGSTKKSYLYGTMHVSGKIAYHLGAEFFEALKSTDAIALESNPIIWLDEIFESAFADDYLGKYEINYQTYKGFYTESFKLDEVDNTALGRQLSENHFLSNWMLYRENLGKSDFEEETFLDMFIYQAGRKNNKPVYSLENFKQSRVFSNLSRLPDIEDKQFSSWYKELLKEKSLQELFQDAYRNQDIDLMDSLSRESSSLNHMNYLLYERNYVMAHKIDSLINENISLFIGIGAAHLPNTKGVIQLLRDKGYTVSPITPTITPQAKIDKETLSSLKSKIDLNQSFQTELFSVKIPNKIYETPGRNFQRQFFAPELTNGTYYTINVLSTYHYFKETEQKKYLSKIDSLLFENIPGKIISKSEITKDGFAGLDVVNETRSGDFQRYQIFITPLKVIIFKMGGKDEYVNNSGQPFFNSISLTKVSEEWAKVSPLKNQYTVEVPGYYDFKFNTQITSLYGHVELEAYDQKEDEYFYLKNASLHDFIYIEEDEFELFHIMDKFVDQFDIDSVFDKTVDVSQANPTATGWAELTNGKIVNLKVVIRGAFYYLMANVSSKKNPDNRFFNSIVFNDFNYTFPFEEKVDSALQFSVTSNYLTPNYYSKLFEKTREMKRTKDEKEDKSYLYKSRYDVYYSENFERVSVESIKFHRYSYFINADSLWSIQTRNFSREKSLFVDSKKSYSNGDTNFFEITYRDTNSYRTVYKKYMQFNDIMYIISSNLDTVNKQSKYISGFYNSFKPLERNDKGLSVFEDKAKIFFDVLMTGDSTETAIAYKSILTHLTFKEEHADQLMFIIREHPFPAEHLNAKAQMIRDLGRLKDGRIIPFLTALYVEMEDTAAYQLAILKALGNQQSKDGCAALVSMLETDIPIGSDVGAIRYLFQDFVDSLEMAKFLFPKILDYTFVADYKAPIYELLEISLDSQSISPKILKKHYPQFLREAKMILKGQISYEQSEFAKKNQKTYYYQSYLNQGNNELIRYCKFLMPFYKDKNVSLFFEKMKLVTDYQVRTDLACQFLKYNISVPEETWNTLIDEPINYAYVYYCLDEIGRLDQFPKNKINQKTMVTSLLYQAGFDFKKDSCQFIKREYVDLGQQEGFVYFYKSKAEDKEKWSLDYVGLQPLDTNKMAVDYAVWKTGIAIAKGKDLDELISEQMKSVVVKNRKRAFEK